MNARNLQQNIDMQSACAAAERWLETGFNNDAVADVRALAVRHLAERTGVLPLFMPAVMLLFLFISPGFITHWPVVAALFLGLAMLAAYRMYVGNRLMQADDDGQRTWVTRYLTTVYITATTWGIMVGMMVFLDGVAWTTQLALMTTLGVTAGGFSTYTVERNLWQRFIVLLWLPIIVLTGAAAVMGLQAGWVLLAMQLSFAWFAVVQGQRIVRQYIASLATQSRLESALQEIQQQRDALEDHQNQLESLVDHTHQLAFYDQLTGLGSRTHFTERLPKMVERCSRANCRFALVHLDLDGFKDINDSMGHDIGDMVLKSVAARLTSTLRGSDFAARLSSDEFALLIGGVESQEDIDLLTRRCLEVLAEPARFGSKRVRITAGIGIAMYPEDGEDAVTLLKAAETAMRAAKRGGKHRVQRYELRLTTENDQRRQIERDLARAIDSEELVLLYQPQIDTASGRLCGAEALVRWLHPVRGMVPPDQFISVAERVGLIDQIGEWVLRTACRQAAQWRRDSNVSLPVAVNISPRQLENCAFYDTVRQVLKETGLPPEMLELEVTESVLQTGTAVCSTLERIRSIGVRIAIDDFGTGYSSLASLKKLPIDCVKIDRVFVADMLQHRKDTMLLGTIIEMAHAFDCRVVAEGVESSRQGEALKSLGCDILQGYLLGRPMPASAILERSSENFLELCTDDGTNGLRLVEQPI